MASSPRRRKSPLSRLSPNLLKDQRKVLLYCLLEPEARKAGLKAGGVVEIRVLEENASAEAEAQWISRLLEEGRVLENAELLPPRHWQERCEKAMEENRKLREEIAALKKSI